MLLGRLSETRPGVAVACPVMPTAWSSFFWVCSCRYPVATYLLEAVEAVRDETVKTGSGS